ncbi:MAG: pyridoxal phosphate-dependent aminotransferase, partial [Pseudomonadota bacterium]|nr:pyridoxal phosphate-dependent aminotransferase [Pseudomonadota bacterium]
TPVVTSIGVCSNSDYHVAGYDGKLETVPYSNNHKDTDANLAAAVAHDSPLMNFAVPNKPMSLV